MNTPLKSLAGALSRWRADPALPRTGVQWLLFLASGLVVGLAAGAVIAIFRIGTDAILAWVRSVADMAVLRDGPEPVAMLCWFGAFALAALLTGFLLRDDWPIRGGGMPWDEEALHIGYAHPWRRILLPKFLGSSLVMAAGVSVGREGPSIQMGAATALGLKENGGEKLPDRELFVFGGCSAGLASAFSAPVGGMCFVFEKMKASFSLPLLLFVLLGGAGVYLSVVVLFGLDYLLPLSRSPLPPQGQLWTLPLLALAAGLVGVTYSWLIRLFTWLYDSLKSLHPLVRPFFPFLAAALFLLVCPRLTGEGLGVVKAMEPGAFAPLSGLLFVVAKLIFTAFCVGSAIPAGRMVPVLVLGGATGALFAVVMGIWGFLAPGHMPVCILVGMGAAFAGSERAPFTGTALVVEMTGAYAALPAVLLTALVGALLARLAKVS